MNGNERELGSEQILSLFAALSDRLAASGTHAHIFIVGGAAMALAYDPRRVTRDVDGIFAPAPEVRQAVKDVAAVEGLEDDWLNDAAKGFMPGGDKHPRTVFESEHLLVQVPSEEYLLAMKLYSARVDNDLDDAATLYNRLGYTTTREGIELLQGTYPAGLLLPRHRYLLDDVVQRAEARRRDRHKPLPPQEPWISSGPDPTTPPLPPAPGPGGPHL
jgi:hypothetical protein